MEFWVFDGVRGLGCETLQSLYCTVECGVPINRIINGVDEDGSQIRAISVLTVLEVGAGQQVNCKDCLGQAVVVVSVVGPVGDCCLSDNLKLWTKDASSADARRCV